MLLNNADNIKLGSQQVDKVCIGGQTVWQSNGLPVGYKLCKYLESDNSADNYNHYIVTDYYAKYYTEVVGVFEMRKNASFPIFGTRNPSYWLMWNVSGRSQFNYYTIDEEILPTSVVDVANGVHTWTQRKNGNNIIYSIDGVEGTVTGTYDRIEPKVGRIALFGYYQQESTPMVDTRRGKLRIYSLKFYENGNIVADFVPCLDDNDNTCMYDRIAKKPYYNLGVGGQFIYELA